MSKGKSKLSILRSIITFQNFRHLEMPFEILHVYWVITDNYQRALGTAFFSRFLRLQAGLGGGGGGSVQQILNFHIKSTSIDFIYSLNEFYKSD